jgi:phosphate transport system substrate-binding protein
MRKTVYALAAAALIAAPAMGQTDLKKLSGNIKIDGSSTVYPITEAVAEEFKKAAPNVNVTVGISGTGGGFKRFAVGETDISDASRPIKKEEHDKALENKIEYIEVPVAYDGLTLVVNNKNTWVDKLTVDEIKLIFVDGAYAKTWKDVRPTWPDRPIKIFSPGTDSGTFDYFKEVVAGDKGSIRGDMSVSEDDNVLVRGVMGSEDAIGFFGCAYYFENEGKLKAVPVVNPKTSEAVLPNAETVEKGTYAPFSRPLFIYVNKKAVARPEVKAFVEFFLAEAPELVSEVGYIKLPGTIYDRVSKNFAGGKTGTQFLNDKGEKVHGPLSDIYK